MKSANLTQELIDLRVKGYVELPDLDSFSVNDILIIIKSYCPQKAVCDRTVQRAIARVEAPPVQWVGNAPYYNRLYTEAVLILLKFKVRK